MTRESTQLGEFVPGTSGQVKLSILHLYSTFVILTIWLDQLCQFVPLYMYSKALYLPDIGQFWQYIVCTAELAFVPVQIIGTLQYSQMEPVMSPCLSFADSPPQKDC